jgi:Tol biopolymer transport system component
MSIAPGTRLGPFDVTAPLGAGGMGQVFRAHDSRLNRDVAIKVLPPEFANDPARMARFAREAQVLAALSHPNIAAIFGLEESGGASALVMELVEGQTLGERIESGPIPLDEVLNIARQIGEALEAAHEKGIIHRDLKPANVKINPEGKVKVLDFGLAKAMDADPISGGGSQPNAQTLTLDSTRAGQIMGTAAYMSPEQARGKPVDKRADIWAFGVVLYEMVTGKSMFEGETVSDTLAAVLRADIDLKHLPADTPPKVRRLLQRCLERDPKRRLRDIGDAWIELDAPDTPAGVAVAAPPPKRAAWLPWTVAIALGGAGIVWGLLKQTPAPPRAVTRWQVPQKGFGVFVDLSRDGTRLAYTGGNINSLQIGVRMLDQFEGKMLPGTEGGFFPRFSPDGQWIVYSTTQNKIKKVPVTGGASITLCDGNFNQGGAWGPDDTIVYSPKGLWRVPASGGTPEAITKVDAQAGETAHSHPQFLPDGQVLFTIAGTGDSWRVAVLDLAKKTYRVIVQTAGARARYVPSGHLLYLRAGTLFALPFDLKRMAPTGNEAPVVEGVSSSGPQNNADYTFSDDGLLVYVAGAAGSTQGTTYAWTDRKGASQAITTAAQPWGTGRLSPDGGRIANGLTRAGSTDRDIWVFDIARNVSTRLTFDGGNDNPIWTPDGRRLIYGGQPNGKSGIYSVAADASSGPELLVAVEGRPMPTSVTPDGKTILFTLASQGRPKIMVYPEGGQPRPLHEVPFAEGDAQVSPDGKWLAYVSAESGSSQEVYVTAFPGPGAKVRISQNAGSWPRWSRNMRELFFWAGNSPVVGLMAVPIQPGSTFQAGKPELLFSGNSGTTWDPAPDSKQFLIETSPATNVATGGANVAVVTDWFEELKRRAPAKK